MGTKNSLIKHFLCVFYSQKQKTVFENTNQTDLYFIKQFFFIKCVIYIKIVLKNNSQLGSLIRYLNSFDIYI